MDLKEIIKWFIPCFHIFLFKKVKMCGRLTYICLFLLFILRPSYGVNADSLVSGDIDTKNVVNFSYLDSKHNQSDNIDVEMARNVGRSLGTFVGRTFGRPMMKKLMTAIIPLAFQIGAASTWAVIAALVGVKTLIVALVILKILLVAGAAKVGALFGHKTHGSSHGWEAPHQKEIHLHIHNGGHPEIHDEHGAILSELKQSPAPPEGVKPVNNGYYFGPPPYANPAGVRPVGGGFFIGAAPTEATKRILNIIL